MGYMTEEQALERAGAITFEFKNPKQISSILFLPYFLHTSPPFRGTQ